jgi:hypothetical protein
MVVKISAMLPWAIGEIRRSFPKRASAIVGAHYSHSRNAGDYALHGLRRRV